MSGCEASKGPQCRGGGGEGGLLPMSDIKGTKQFTSLA